MYDVLIIGAGMSGLAAGIRLAMFGSRVCILERHYALGGLNSYYRLGGRNYDVGLHALTNFAPRGAKHGPLPRLLRQLRIGWDDFELAEQNGSAIDFPGARLRFNNDPATLQSEIERLFPSQKRSYQCLLMTLLNYDELHFPIGDASARELLSATLGEPLLVEMLLCPVLFYGGPREGDMSWREFSVMFRSIFLEGLSRPRGGIRVILKHLTKRFKQLGGELRLRAGVKNVIEDNGRAVGVVLDDGTQLSAKQVISSAGWNETMRLCLPGDNAMADSSHQKCESGRLTFLESICTLDRLPRDLDFKETIVFYNNSNHFDYRCPDDFADLASGIVCSPNNYRYEESGQEAVGAGQLAETETTDHGLTKIDPTEGTLRLTALANYDRWAALTPDEYQSQKRRWHDQIVKAAARFVPNLEKHIVASDTFTPKTIVHFTGHDRGAVYGAPQKRYDARTHLANLLICGADQGYVGIVGTLTSGIQVANMVLQAGIRDEGLGSRG